MSQKAFHGGAFFEAIGQNFQTLERAEGVISADVLDAWFDASPAAILKVAKHLAFAFRTSPPTHAEGLIKTISEIRGLSKDQILVGSGSSDLMFVLFQILLKSDDHVVILDPMYGEYAHIFTKVVPVDLSRVPLNKENGFEIYFDKFADFIRSKKPEMVCLVNPSSPTGRYWPKENIARLCEYFSNITFVVDEAYIDYVGKEHSLETNVGNHPNLIVLKSMSKAYALSGLRVAYAVCSPAVREQVNKFIPPWSVSLVGQIAGVEALLDEAYYLEKYKETHRIRQQMVKRFTGVNSVKVYDSCANFFMLELFSVGADKLVAKLAEEGIYIRNCDSMGEKFNNNFVRVAVKDAATSHKLADAILRVLEPLESVR